MRLADVRAVRVGRRRTGDCSAALGEVERLRLIVKTEDRLQPLPGRETLRRESRAMPRSPGAPNRRLS